MINDALRTSMEWRIHLMLRETWDVCSRNKKIVWNKKPKIFPIVWRREKIKFKIFRVFAPLIPAPQKTYCLRSRRMEKKLKWSWDWDEWDLISEIFFNSSSLSIWICQQHYANSRVSKHKSLRIDPRRRWSLKADCSSWKILQSFEALRRVLRKIRWGFNNFTTISAYWRPPYPLPPFYLTPILGPPSQSASTHPPLRFLSRTWAVNSYERSLGNWKFDFNTPSTPSTLFPPSFSRIQHNFSV